MVVLSSLSLPEGQGYLCGLLRGFVYVVFGYCGHASGGSILVVFCLLLCMLCFENAQSFVLRNSQLYEKKPS